MRLVDIDPGEAIPARAFQEVTLNVLRQMLPPEERQLVDAHARLALDLHASQLTYRHLLHTAVSFFDGIAPDALFRRLSTYAAFEARHEAQIASLMPKPIQLRERFSEHNTTWDFIHDYTSSIQWVAEPTERYDMKFVNDTRTYFTHAQVPLTLRELYTVLFNIIDITIHNRFENDTDALSLSMLTWLDDLCDWYAMTLTWQQAAIGAAER